MTTDTDKQDKTLSIVTNGEFSSMPELPEVLKRKQGSGVYVFDVTQGCYIDKESGQPLEVSSSATASTGPAIVEAGKSKKAKGKNSVVPYGKYKAKRSYIFEESREDINKSALDWREQELIDILQTCRVADSPTELEFIKNYIDSLPGVQTDSYGNRYIEIPELSGEPSPVAFSCHTDSVHDAYGKQAISIDKGVIGLAFKSQSNCLGADDGTGVWLMRHMALEKVPGLYLFHRKEESGMQGSQWLATNNRKLLDGIKAVIAFDRKGRGSIITHQMGQRTASQDFAFSFAKAMLKATDGKVRLAPDSGGSFTDSYAYEAFISECTNISVGYFSQHGNNETQDMDFATRLLNGLIAMDWSTIKFTRDPATCRRQYYGRGYSSGYGGGWGGLDEWPGETSGDTYGKSSYAEWSSRVDSRYGKSGTFASGGTEGYKAPSSESFSSYEWEDMTQLCQDYPEVMASLLLAYGVDLKEAREAVFRDTGEDLESEAEQALEDDNEN